MVALKFLRFYFGFVRVKATGLYPERIINLCYKNGITVWHIKKKEEVLYFNIASKDFKQLRAIRNKCAVSLKIKHKIGLPFVIKKHKNRAGVLVGLLLFFIGLNLLSSFVWNINVVGNSGVSTEEILSQANKIGIYEGMPKKQINSPVMRNTMLYNFNKLSWVSFNLEGSLLTINVSETKQVEKQNHITPTNLVATKDGVIKYLEIKSGYAAVKTGQAVKKGDLLVSGVAEFKEGVSHLYNSNGIVLAETEIIYNNSLPLQEEKYVLSGDITKKSVLQFFGINIPLYLGSVKGEYNKQVNKHYIKTNQNYLPIKLVTTEFHKKVKTKVTKTQEEAQKELMLLADEAIKTDKIKKVISVKDDFSINNGKVTIHRTARVLEDIATPKNINIVGLS